METSAKKRKEAVATKATEAVSEETRVNAPVKQFRIEDVSASIFAREYNGITYHSVSFTRSYKDAKGTWKYSRSFDRDDLGKVADLAQQAAEYIYGIEKLDSEESED